MKLCKLEISMGLIALVISQLSCAQTTNNTPAGLWQSVDDATGKPRAEIQITVDQGVYSGRIVRSLLPNTTGAIQTCGLCTDERKGQPLIGLQIIRQIRRVGDSAVWGGGEILDPDKGKTYKLQLQLLGEGKQLQVRGYIGPFFRNQVWQRVP
jgi:uncharacterized protein (DUF2147 family)